MPLPESTVAKEPASSNSSDTMETARESSPEVTFKVVFERSWENGKIL